MNLCVQRQLDKQADVGEHTNGDVTKEDIHENYQSPEEITSVSTSFSLKSTFITL